MLALDSQPRRRTRLLRRLPGPALALAVAACATCTPNPGPSLINVTPRPALTVLPGGATGPETSFTLGTSHGYRVGANVTLEPGATFDPSDTGVSILYIHPVSGQEEGSGVQPSTSDPTLYEFDLPGVQSLDLCEPLFYRWTAVYDITNGARGAYIGEILYVMPSQRRVSSNQIQQAMCVTPTTSPWGDL